MKTSISPKECPSYACTSRVYEITLDLHLNSPISQNGLQVVVAIPNIVVLVLDFLNRLHVVESLETSHRVSLTK
jgi:hypothetical protein